MSREMKIFCFITLICVFYCLKGFISQFLFDIWRNFIHNRDKSSNVDRPMWACYDDHNMYSEPSRGKDLTELMDFGNRLLGTGVSFNGNYVNSFYHEEYEYVFPSQRRKKI